MNYIAGGVGKVLMFLGNKLYGIANTLTDNTFDFTITGDEIRGGKKNMLLGQYFHDSALGITLTNALFNFDDISLALGLPINESGGLSIKEEQIEAGEGTLTVTETAIATHGEIIGWYKKPSETLWNIGYISDKTMTVSGAHSGDVYCVKYFWNNENARSMNLRADYEPTEIHLVIIQDLFSAEENDGEVTPGAKAGSIITDIPRFKPSGNENLGFTSGGTASTSLSGNALAVVDTSKCGESYSYGTMTEEIYNIKWQDRVVAIAVENGDVELAQSGSEELVVRVVYGGNAPSQRKDNSNFDFAIESTPESTATLTAVGKNTGVITAGQKNGAAVVSVKLKDYEGPVEPAYVHVTVNS